MEKYRRDKGPQIRSGSYRPKRKATRCEAFCTAIGRMTAALAGGPHVRATATANLKNLCPDQDLDGLEQRNAGDTHFCD